MHFRHMAPEKKYFKVRPAKKTTMVLLLLKDDKQKYLTPSQRSDLLLQVGPQYQAAKKKAMIDALPKYDLKNLPDDLTAEELLKAIKQKRVVGL